MCVISSRADMNNITVRVNWTVRHPYFKRENFHHNLKLKKVQVLVNGILQFLHFMPLGLYFLFCVLFPLLTSVKEFVYLENKCKLSAYVCVCVWARRCVCHRVCQAAVFQSEQRFDTLEVTAADLLQVSTAASWLSESISGSDVWAAQTYLGYQKKAWKGPHLQYWTNLER